MKTQLWPAAISTIGLSFFATALFGQAGGPPTPPPPTPSASTTLPTDVLFGRSQTCRGIRPSNGGNEVQQGKNGSDVRNYYPEDSRSE